MNTKPKKDVVTAGSIYDVDGRKGASEVHVWMPIRPIA